MAHRVGLYQGFGSAKRTSNNCLLLLGQDAGLSQGNFRQAPKVPATRLLLGGQEGGGSGKKYSTLVGLEPGSFW